jgi:hypothetical protein
MKVKLRGNQNENIGVPAPEAPIKSGGNRWRKFQYYGLPTNEQSQKYKDLNALYKLLYDDYIKDNGLRDEKLVLYMK